MISKILLLALLVLLSGFGVLGDYFLKKGGQNGIEWKYVALAALIFGSTAMGWFLVYRRFELSSAGVIYGVTTALLLVIMGVVFFKENVNGYEKLGIAFALLSLLLLGRFA